MMYLDIPRLKYLRGIVKDIHRHNEDIISLYIELKDRIEVEPGQFIMLWMPGFEEVPLSPSYCDGYIMRLTVMKRGETTEAIHKLVKGDKVFFRGPYGKGFKLSEEGRYMLVGGGYGASPIIYAAHRLAKYNSKAVYVEGVKSSKYALFIKEAKSLGHDTVLVTEDGSSEFKGYVTDYVEKVAENFDYIIGCGPEAMLVKLAKICLSKAIHCQLSFEAIVKCGIGLCGSCELGETGYMVCRDGPVFDLEAVSKYIGGV